MARILLTIILVLMILFVVAFLVYGSFSTFAGLETPGGALPSVFLTSVLVMKTGHAVAFVLIFYLARSSFSQRWLLYAFLWWLMFATVEVGQAIGPGYSWNEAIAGVISETIYFPAAAFVTNRLIGTRLDHRAT